MKLFADENLARSIVIRLRERGHDLLYAGEIQPGAPDTHWLARAEAERRIILTATKTLGNWSFATE
jgi:hypothetical protein